MQRANVYDIKQGPYLKCFGDFFEQLTTTTWCIYSICLPISQPAYKSKWN